MRPVRFFYTIGAIIPQGIAVVVVDGHYKDTLEYNFDIFFGAGESANAYTIATSEDECRVILVLLEIRLIPN